MSGKHKPSLAVLAWGGLLVAVVVFLAIPATNGLFARATAARPYLMGFAKFFLLSSMGELLALRLRAGRWQWTRGFVPKAVVWGIIGVFITFMFGFYYTAVSTLQEAGRMPGQTGRFLTAFFTSSLMNLTFGPAFMIAHRLSDTLIELILDRRGGNPLVSVNAGRSGNAGDLGKPAAAGEGRDELSAGDGNRIGLRAVLDAVNWPAFLRVIILTLLFFWIPVHTLVFLLPPVYRVVGAALLSIVLGVILAMANRSRSS